MYRHCYSVRSWNLIFYRKGRYPVTDRLRALITHYLLARIELVLSKSHVTGKFCHVPQGAVLGVNTSKRSLVAQVDHVFRREKICSRGQLKLSGCPNVLRYRKTTLSSQSLPLIRPLTLPGVGATTLTRR